MRIGVPKEIKNHEYRVGLTPASVKELVAAGHELFVETKAGSGIDCPDGAYQRAGATIVGSPEEVTNALFEFRAAGITQFLFMGWPDMEEMTNFHRDVLPRVREREQDEAA